MISQGFNGRYSRNGNKLHDQRKQIWAPGMVVNVGFMKGLRVIGRISRKLSDSSAWCDQWLVMTAKGDFYAFEPHYGLMKITGHEVEDYKHLVKQTYAVAR